MSPYIQPTSSPTLIIGGGLGGLALAQGLKKAGIPCHVFERDPTPDFRAQGYRLKLNPDGVTALKSVLTPELYQYFEETCAECEAGETDFNATDASITASRKGQGVRDGVPIQTCDRTVLRNILLTGLDDCVSYGKQLVEYSITEKGVIATFKDGTAHAGNFLVGADGTRSVVRKQYLPEHKPVDTNGSCIYGKTPITPALRKRFPQRATRWMTLVVDRTPMTQTLDIDETPLTLLLEPIRFRKNAHQGKLPADYIYWVLVSRTDVFNAAYAKDLLHLTSEESAALSLELTDEWDPSIRALLELQDVAQSSTLRVASAVPNPAPWEASEWVTLLGDAIHAMSPCGGVGAATALRDAALLTETIVQNGTKKESIAKYEDAMRGYAKLAIERSLFGGKKMFGQKPFEQCKALDV